MSPSANELVARVLRRPWTAEDTEAYLGARLGAVLAHATDDDLRAGAASGGAVSALLAHLLESGRIDGALVCRAQVVADACGKRCVRPRFGIARTRAEVLAARGSAYVATDFAADALPLIEAFDGRLAVVGLPCDLTLLRRRMGADPALADKVAIAIGLVCGHNSVPALIDSTVERLEAEAGARLNDFQFRVGHWRGQLRATFENGTVIEKPSSYYNVYQNLFYFADRKCMHCGDHFASAADIAAGDVWSYRLKDDPVKHTGVLVKTEAGRDTLSSAVDAGVIGTAPLSYEELLEGQVRTAPLHRNVCARAAAAKRYGVKIPVRESMPVSWHERLAAGIIVRNWHATSTPEGARKVLRVPRGLLKGYLYVLKGLESLR